MLPLLTVYARMQVIQVITWAPASTVRQSTVDSGLRNSFLRTLLFL